jgi:hypothetical protein
VSGKKVPDTTGLIEVQWTMNSTPAEIGIHFPKLRKRAIAIGETLGIYRDLTLRPDLDQLHGKPARVNEQRRTAG